MSPRRSRRALLLASLLAPLLAGVPALGSAAAADPFGTARQRTWHADQARVPAARAAGHDGSGVLVAVLDSWVDRGHPDFEGRVLAGADCATGTCRPGAARADLCDHGTHVAGTVASSSFGVAPRARVLPVRVLSFDPLTAECSGTPSAVAAGITWAVGQGARVLNLSLGPEVAGTEPGPVLVSAVHAAAAAGVLVVLSAGNNPAGAGASGDMPATGAGRADRAAAYGPDALVVAATGPSGRLASYSRATPGVDLAAPGGDPVRPGHCSRADCVTSLFPADGYAVAAGTSMAAPHVSGVAALLLAQQPTRTRDDLVARLTGSARPLAGAGAGALDAAAALGVAPRQGTVGAVRAPATLRASAPRPAAAPRPRSTAPTAAPLLRARVVPSAPPGPLPGPPVTVAALLLGLAALGTLHGARRTRGGTPG